MTSVIRREGKLERENLQYAVENHLMRLPKLAPNTTSNEPNNTIQLRNCHENQITKEFGISVARAKLFM
jgi:hypothetical protein